MCYFICKCCKCFTLIFFVSMIYVSTSNAYAEDIGCTVRMEITKNRIIKLVNDEQLCKCLGYTNLKHENNTTKGINNACVIRPLDEEGKLGFSSKSICSCAGYDVNLKDVNQKIIELSVNNTTLKENTSAIYREYTSTPSINATPEINYTNKNELTKSPVLVKSFQNVETTTTSTMEGNGTIDVTSNRMKFDPILNGSRVEGKKHDDLEEVFVTSVKIPISSNTTTIRSKLLIHDDKIINNISEVATDGKDEYYDSDFDHNNAIEYDDARNLEESSGHSLEITNEEDYENKDDTNNRMGTEKSLSFNHDLTFDKDTFTGKEEIHNGVKSDVDMRRSSIIHDSNKTPKITALDTKSGLNSSSQILQEGSIIPVLIILLFCGLVILAIIIVSIYVYFCCLKRGSYTLHPVRENNNVEMDALFRRS